MDNIKGAPAGTKLIYVAEITTTSPHNLLDFLKLYYYILVSTNCQERKNVAQKIKWLFFKSDIYITIK